MSVVVYKYELTSGVNTFDIPEGAQTLCVQEQNDVICLWALVDNERPTVQRTFIIYHTGQEIRVKAVKAYIGTVQINGGYLVSHIFEI